MEVDPTRAREDVPESTTSCALHNAVQKPDQLRGDDGSRLGEARLSILDSALTDRAPSCPPPHMLVSQARAYIRRHDPSLNVYSVGRHHHVAVRTLERAFAADGRTLTELIRTLRLHALRRNLADPCGVPKVGPRLRPGHLCKI